jgi:hypothetical protein
MPVKGQEARIVGKIKDPPTVLLDIPGLGAGLVNLFWIVDDLG